MKTALESLQSLSDRLIRCRKLEHDGIIPDEEIAALDDAVALVTALRKGKAMKHKEKDIHDTEEPQPKHPVTTTDPLDPTPDPGETSGPPEPKPEGGEGGE